MFPKGNIKERDFQVNLDEFCARVVVDDLIHGALKEDARNAAEDLFFDSEVGAFFSEWRIGEVIFWELVKPKSMSCGTLI